MNKNITDNDILKTWQRYKTVKSVSRELGISYQRVLKGLSTKGVIINDTHSKIIELTSQGKTTEEIANILHMNKSTIECYLPRSRPEYGFNQSENAKKLQIWRDSKK